MKKLLLLGIVFSVVGMINTVKAAENTESDPQLIKNAIEKYKEKNYLGCISDLRLYVSKEPSSAIAWYYLGNSYMNIAMTTEAHKAFDKVVQLNTVPKLTSYSIQAELCMENADKCKYHNFTYEEIKKLKADPAVFISQYLAKLQNFNSSSSTDAEIEKLIKGGYSNNIHPDAREFIMEQKAKMKQMEINANKAYVNDGTSFAMLLENNPADNTSYTDLLNYYKNPQNKNELTPEMIQLMMTSNMLMPNL